LQLEKIVRRALEEDLGRGDITSEAIVSRDIRGSGSFLCKSNGIVAGMAYARTAFHLLDSDVQLEPFVNDGGAVTKGSVIGRVYGNARSILSAERVALNFLQRLSGIATATASAVKAVEPFGTRIVDTRKTTPGLRLVEKYAVRVGGGSNHRMGLDDAVLIKDNHIEIAGGIKRAVRLARENVGHLVKIEVETETLEQVQEAIESGADVIMLDNMTCDCMKEAVNLVSGRVLVEASGGLTPDVVADVAAAGVDVISLGWITHSAQPLDISLELHTVK